MFIKIVFYLNLISVFLISIAWWKDDDFGAIDQRFLRTLLVVGIIEAILLYYLIYVR